MTHLHTRAEWDAYVSRPSALEWAESVIHGDPDAGRDDVLVDPDVDDDSHVEREPLLYRVGARLRREWALWSCLGWSTHTRCTHALALAGGVTR